MLRKYRPSGWIPFGPPAVFKFFSALLVKVLCTLLHFSFCPPLERATILSHTFPYDPQIRRPNNFFGPDKVLRHPLFARFFWRPSPGSGARSGSPPFEAFSHFHRLSSCSSNLEATLPLQMFPCPDFLLAPSIFSFLFLKSILLMFFTPFWGRPDTPVLSLRHPPS